MLQSPSWLYIIGIWDIKPGNAIGRSPSRATAGNVVSRPHEPRVPSRRSPGRPYPDDHISFLHVRAMSQELLVPKEPSLKCYRGLPRQLLTVAPLHGSYVTSPSHTPLVYPPHLPHLALMLQMRWSAPLQG